MVVFWVVIWLWRSNSCSPIDLILAPISSADITSPPDSERAVEEEVGGREVKEAVEGRGRAGTARMARGAGAPL